MRSTQLIFYLIVTFFVQAIPKLIIQDVVGTDSYIYVDINDDGEISPDEAICKINEAQFEALLTKLNNPAQIKFGREQSSFEYKKIGSETDPVPANLGHLQACYIENQKDHINLPNKVLYLGIDYTDDNDTLCQDNNFDFECDASEISCFVKNFNGYKSGQKVKLNNVIGNLFIIKKTSTIAFNAKKGWCGTKFSAAQRIML